MRKNKSGIFLVSVLFMAVLIAMFVGASVALAPASLGQAAFEARQASAQRAALTGLSWAQARLRNTPDWNASVANSTVLPDFQVQEAEGQVVGWIHEGERWNRFRIRFNWQDGPISPSDGMNDPTKKWSDFILVSSNNLRGASPKDILQANGANGSVTAASPLRLKLPENSVLLSIEGTSGSTALDGSGNPLDFSGTPQKRHIEVVMRLSGPNQAVTPAAVMAAGDLSVTLENASTGLLNLAASATQATRLRTKGTLQITQGGSPNVVSSKGELSANAISNITLNGAPSNVGKVAENSGDGFYSIPEGDVKAPHNPAQPQAGVYVVNKSGGLTYYDMDFAAYQTAKSTGTLPAGTTTAAIPGISVSTSPTSPKVRMTATQDLAITPTGSAQDFVIIPDGGAPATNNTYDHAQASSAVQNYFNNYNTGWLSPSTTSAYSGWYNTMPNIPSVNTPAANTWVWTASNGATATLTQSSNQWTRSSGWNGSSAMEFAAAIASTFDPANPNAAQSLANFNYLASQASCPAYQPTPLLPGSNDLIPAELQLSLQDPAGGSLVVKNSGSIVLGSQVIGNGAALVSAKDIQLLGTSSDFSSNPSTATSLNLYAKGNVLVSSFKLDSAGVADFHKADFKGVVYSWGNVTINVGDTSVPANKWGTMNLQGALVAFGGDPANPVPGYSGSTSKGKFTFSGKNARIQFDPSFLMGLYQNLPQPLSMQIVSWHER